MAANAEAPETLASAFSSVLGLESAGCGWVQPR